MTEDNGKSRNSRTHNEHRKRIIRLFSEYCKDRGWGKAYATKELAGYYYRENTPDYQKQRDLFEEKWISVIETVINKPAKTTLSKPSNRELFDFIEVYISDVAENDYLREQVEASYENIKNSLEDLCTNYKKEEVNKVADRISGRYFGIRSKIHDEYRGKLYIRLDFWDGAAFKCTFLKYEDTYTGLERRVYKGVVTFQGDKQQLFLSGLLIDELERKICTIRIAGQDTISFGGQLFSDRVLSDKATDDTRNNWKNKKILIDIGSRRGTFKQSMHADSGDLLLGILTEIDRRENAPMSDEIRKDIEELNCI